MFRLFLSVDQKRWIFTHLPSTNLKMVFCIVLLDFFSFKKFWSHTPPSLFFNFWSPHFRILTSICSWSPNRSENECRGIFKYAECNFLKKILINITQNHSLAVFKPPEHKFELEKSLRWLIEGLQVHFPENFKIAVWSWNYL